MEVQMFPDTGSGSLPLVEADIDAFAVKMFLQHQRAALHQVHDLVRLIRFKLGQRHHMPIGTDHDMPVAVREFVHDHKSIPAPVQDQPLLVFIPAFGKTKNTAVRFGTKDVLDAPGRPQLFHFLFLNTRLALQGQVLP